MSPSPSRSAKTPVKSKAAKSTAKPKAAAQPARAKPKPKASAKPAKVVAKSPAKKAVKVAAKKVAKKAAIKPAKKVATKPAAKGASPKPVSKTPKPQRPAPMTKAAPALAPAPAAAPPPIAPVSRPVEANPAPVAPAPATSTPPPPAPRPPQGQSYPPRGDRPPQQPNQQSSQQPNQQPSQQQNRPPQSQGGRPGGGQGGGGGGGGGGGWGGGQRPPQSQNRPQQGQHPQDRGPRPGQQPQQPQRPDQPPQGQPGQPNPPRADSHWAHRHDAGGGNWSGGGDRSSQRQQHRPHQQAPRPEQSVGSSASSAVVDAAEPSHPSLGETRQPPTAAAHDHPIAPAGPSHPGRDEVFERGMKFADLGLRDSVLKGITEAGFEFPTAIQARIIPVILSGKDVLGQAKTGTGKTAAFGLPLLHRTEKGQPFQALVLVPTRELAIQVATDLKELGRFTPLHILPVYGGQNVKTQAQLLSKGPEIIVATPGRVMDMVQRGYINYRSIKTVVLDEVDRMLDIGFRDDIRRILSGCPKDRQTVFVSATISPEVEALARSFANQCEKIIASAGSLTVSMVKQWHLPVAPWDKKQLLLHLLTHEEPALTVVFCRTKKTVDNIAEYLQRKGVDCHAIHGDMYQNKRNKVMEQLRAGKLEVLIASDVASRGLDVEGITHVINYDLPEDPDLYVHRIGRTARAGREGVAWSLVTPEQGGLLTEIELLINAEIPKLDYPDFKPGPIPQGVLESKQFDANRAQRAKQFNRFSSALGPAQPAPAPASPQPSGAGGAPAAGAGGGGAYPSAGAGHTPAFSPPDADAARFPGGIIPTKAPPKRMFGRVKTARSMKAAMQQSFTPPVNPAAQPDAAPTAPVQVPPADG